MVKKSSLNKKRSLELQSKILTPDGTGLFIRFLGPSSAQGRLPILLNDGLGCNGFIWKHFIEYFRHQHPIIHWHYRGHGHSDIPTDLKTVSIQQLGQDVGTILNHFGISKAILAGHSMGIQVALEAFRSHPNRCAGLVLLNGSYEFPLETWHDKSFLNQAMKSAFPWLHRVFTEKKAWMQPLWSSLFHTDIPYLLAMLFEVNRHRVLKEDFMPYFEHLSRMQGHVFMRMLHSYSNHSAKAILDDVNVPTLIVSGGQDTFSPHQTALDMKSSITNSELLYIPDGTHCTPIEHPELIHLRVEKFLCPILTQASDNSCKPTIGISMHAPASRRPKRTAHS